MFIKLFFHAQDVSPQSEATVLLHISGTNFSTRPTHLSRVNEDIFTFVSMDDKGSDLAAIDLRTGSLNMPCSFFDLKLDTGISCVAACGAEHLAMYYNKGSAYCEYSTCREFILVPNRPRRVADYLQSREYLLIKRWESKGIDYLT